MVYYHIVIFAGEITKNVWYCSLEGEEDHSGGTAEAAPAGDGAHCQDVWGPRDYAPDAVYQVS